MSDSLRDLLSKILVDDPQKRISMKEIQRHPWYLEDLPEGVADMNDELPLPGDDVQAILLLPFHPFSSRARDSANFCGLFAIPASSQYYLPPSPDISESRWGEETTSIPFWNVLAGQEQSFTAFAAS